MCTRSHLRAKAVCVYVYVHAYVHAGIFVLKLLLAAGILTGLPCIAVSLPKEVVSKREAEAVAQMETLLGGEEAATEPLKRKELKAATGKAYRALKARSMLYICTCYIQTTCVHVLYTYVHIYQYIYPCIHIHVYIYPYAYPCIHLQTICVRTACEE